jgi:hypothetical protein
MKNKGLKNISQIALTTAFGHLEVLDLNLLFPIEIDTTSYCAEILIGRRLLEQLIFQLHGPEKKLTIE